MLKKMKDHDKLKNITDKKSIQDIGKDIENGKG